MKKFLKYFVFITYPFFILATIFFVYDFREQTRRGINLLQTHKEGVNIVFAIYEYHQEQKSYPRDLKELVPKYIEEINEPLWGTSGWMYEADVNGFSLKAGYDFGRSSLYPVLYYSSWSKKWGLND